MFRCYLTSKHQIFINGSYLYYIMANYTMKDIPESLFIKIKERAEKNKRSFNGQIQYDMEQLIEKEEIKQTSQTLGDK